MRLPAQFRFDTAEVFIRQDPVTQDVILSRRPSTWDGLWIALQPDVVPADFLSPSERAQNQSGRDPLDLLEGLV